MPILGAGNFDGDDDLDMEDETLGFPEDGLNEKDEQLSNNKFLFFDFESMFVDNQHVPNFCVAQWRCEICLDAEKRRIPRDESYQMIDPQEADDKNIDIEYPMDKCRCGKTRERTFSGPNTKTDFCDFLFSDHHRDTIVNSHNGKAYDNIFCLEHLLKTKGILPEVIFTGSKVMCITLPSLGFKIIDSYQLFGYATVTISHHIQLDRTLQGLFPLLFQHTSKPKLYRRAST